MGEGTAGNKWQEGRRDGSGKEDSYFPGQLKEGQEILRRRKLTEGREFNSAVLFPKPRSPCQSSQSNWQ